MTPAWLTKKQMRALAAQQREHLSAAAAINEVLLANMRNRPPVMRSARRSTKLTPEMREQVRQMHDMFPLLSQNAIGEMLQIDSGRVSEILAGKRGDDA